MPPGITARAVDAQADALGIQDAAQRPQSFEQVWPLSRPDLAVLAGDCEHPVPAIAAGGQRPPLLTRAGQHQDQVILSHDQVVGGQRWNSYVFTLMPLT